MLTETGRVVAHDDAGFWVETIRQSTCGTCAAQKGCGHSLINKVSDGKRNYIHVLPGEHSLQACDLDDEVRFSIPEEVILRGSFIAYMMPLLSMLAGASVAVQWLGVILGVVISQDAAAAIGAISGLALGFAGVRWHAQRHRQDVNFQPVLLEVVGPTTNMARAL